MPAGQGSLAMMPLPTRPRSSPLALSDRLWSQPQRDVGRLHRLPHHAYEVVVQRFDIRLVPEFGGEFFEGLRGLVLAPVNAAVYERLDASPRRSSPKLRYAKSTVHVPRSERPSRVNSAPRRRRCAA